MKSTLKFLSSLAVALTFLAVPARADSPAEDLRLTVGKSVVIDYAGDIRQILTSNPDVVDASAITTREVILHAKGLGLATVVVWNKEGQRYFYNVNVELSLEALRKLIRETFPSEDIHVQSSRDSLSLTGKVSNQATSERAAAMAAGFAKSVVNNMVVNTQIDKQIVLHVRFAELDRTKATQFGFNVASTAGGTVSGMTTGQYGSPTATGNFGSSTGTTALATISNALNLFAFKPGINLGLAMEALQTKGVLQILAEPNLVTSSGKEAQFLVGGEVPIPVLQGGANASSVTIQFKEFGVRLKFLPTVTPNKTIKMDLMQEVSSIDVANGASFNGFVIPAMSTRRTSTSIELGERQSFLVSGLLDNRDTESFSKIPGVSSIPVLGQLFRSKSIQKGLTELVLVVTPEITMPMNPDETKPMLDFPNEFLVPLTPVAPQPVKHSRNTVKESKGDQAN